MQRVNKSMLLEPSSTTDKRFFVRLGSDVCPADALTLARSVSSATSSEIMAISLQSGEYCADDSKYMPPHVPSEGSGSISSDDSDWKHDLRFIIPISVCMFLLGCAGLVYVLRQQKNAPSETPKDDAKGITTSLPYVLSIHPLV
ncbi:unnamed protein product [Phytophthora lilii]|uniref:Unnamed protein product n=1 Tax=Phytophthora lilii TaxID=2077276 RepID=A0A9W6TFL6_9STRA|nr:unnamed protein product [Phytophthora lilii]